MKCITAIKDTNPYKQGHMLRLEDKVADRKVSSGYWKFISKSEFKGSDGTKEVLPVEQTQSKKSNEPEKKSYGRKKTK